MRYSLYTNNYDNIGLNADYGHENAQLALNFYEKTLKQLFLKEIQLGNTKFRKGEILWLEDNDESQNKALIYIFGALTMVSGRKFAEKVLKKKEEIESSPFSDLYLRVLTDEEIAELYVPPRFR